MPYKIRQVDGCNERIAAILHHLHYSTFKDTAPPCEPELGWWWIVYHGSEPVAFAGIVPSATTTDGGYLVRSGVLEGHRGHGLQRRLLRVREAFARRVGWRRTLTDTTDNPASSNNLIRAGYRMFDPDTPWGPDGACYWQKVL